MGEGPFLVLSRTPPGLFDLAAFLEGQKEASFYAFLESSRTGPEDARHLFFREPVKILSLHPEDNPWEFFASLEKALEEGLWVVGYFAYELGYLLEKRLLSLLPEISYPLALVGLFRAPEEFSASLTRAYQPKPLDLEDLRLSLTEGEYFEAIRKIKDYIAAGDTYQVNYTLKYLFGCSHPPEEVYLSLRSKQRVRYGGLFKAGDLSVVSLSPELFLRKEGPSLWTKPMKGTAPRGFTLEEDQKIASWLAKDPKNQAENVMIVDLLRNDLGRVCAPGSVYVPALFEVEKYETVFQMISTVKGELKEFSLSRLFRGLFPCGSVTGAPKIRTMEIIAELEKAPRGVYTGALGFISPERDFVFNVAIRTLSLRGHSAEFGIGSGIVWDSDPEKEYEECLLKARFLTEPPKSFALLETMRFSPEQGVPLWPWHLKRLREAASYFDYPLDVQAAEELLAEAMRELSSEAKLRLLLGADGTLRLEAHSLTPLTAPVKMALAERDWPPSPFVFHKTTYRPWFERWQRRARALGLFEIVFFDDRGRLLEGTITNIFLKMGGRLLTPPKKLGLLPGVLRQSLLEEGLVEERELFLEDLSRAEKIFLGNAVRGLFEVSGWYLLDRAEGPAVPEGGLSRIEDEGL
ncbi:MAG: aminodeoxychorismate synthase component I [Thermodesulfobacteria bacterium]|nr:aminodeoxychorismate synthase component I [Thermodesulfobacteriota bacterium]